MAELQRWNTTGLAHHPMQRDDAGVWVKHNDLVGPITACVCATRYRKAEAWYEKLRYCEEPRDQDAIDQAWRELEVARDELDIALALIGDESASQRMNGDDAMGGAA